MSTFVVGMEVPFVEVSLITREQLKEYATASGDYNPIHVDEEAAKKAGLPGVIAHGMLIAAFLGNRGNNFMKNQSGSDWRLHQFKTRFKSMTFPGDQISIGGTIKEASDEKITLQLKAVDGKGDVKALGTLAYQRLG